MMYYNEKEKIFSAIDHLLNKKESIIIAIDGRCASGKTTLASEIKKKYSCNLISADDFFLQPFQRTEKRLCEIGGNLDRERLLNEVLLPLKSKKTFSYRPFLCESLTFGEKITVEPNRLTVIEGTYSCHKDLRELYDLVFFLTVEPNEQLNRLKKRENKESLIAYIEKWIPLEEKYFENIKP